ncbi:MAG: ribulose-phosphate 3-epimerase [Candidatus Marinimicrobia bacterium]|nr:ribulose-phosphate 3-epimerase [Candidatus Neomarinimicrobiota bacterium]|tara:strand:+ start:24810 stop:25457 length:648 start_codon:yes stop_codon:yes gene_type:complete
MKNRIISPSLLSADFSKLKEQIDVVVDAGATRLHLDVMDGHFVPNFTFGPFIVKAIRKLTDAHLETHLMISNPEKYLQDFIDAGSDTLIFHYEASNDINRDIDIIKSNNILAGIAINPDTDISNILPFLDSLDYVLIMSVNPGFGGQGFIDETLEKMKKLSSLSLKYDFIVGVDGGVNLNTINKVYETGVDVTIVGSGLYKSDNINKRFNDLMKR